MSNKSRKNESADMDLEMSGMAESSKMLDIPTNGTTITTKPPSHPEKKLPYPKGVVFISITELFERFAYYGSRAVLTMYMRNVLSFSEDLSTTLYHTFLLLCYCLPVFWGIASDSTLGMYKTLWIVNLLFLLGNGLLTASSFTGILAPVPLTMIGLVLMAVATGGMKPCLSPFGAEQFVLPQQSLGLQHFFSVFFVATTLGNMISTVVTPVLRKDVQCLQMDTCYPLAFGVPCVFMFFAVVMFLAGRRFYKVRKPDGNMLIKAFHCIKHALVVKRKSEERKAHWLDHAEGKYGPQLISDIKGFFRLLIYYLPMPMFYALLEQLGSSWTLQATRMSGRVRGLVIKPDQMQVSNAIFMFLFTPFFSLVLYPLCSKWNLLRRPLQRMGLGLFFASASFLTAGLVQTQIEVGQNPYFPSLGDTKLRFVNTLPCSINLTGQHENDGIGLTLRSEETAMLPLSLISRDLGNLPLFPLTVELLDGNCSLTSSSFLQTTKWTGNITLLKVEFETNVLIYFEGGGVQVFVPNVPQDFTQSTEGNSKIGVVFNRNSGLDLKLKLKSISNPGISFNLSPTKSNLEPEQDFVFSDPVELPPDKYLVHTASATNNTVGMEQEAVDLGPGGVYLIFNPPNRPNNELRKMQVTVVVKPNEIHMLWLVPQYILMAWAQILFIVSGMEFSYTQAPKSMKSVMAALWSLMNAFGNVIVILSVSIHTTSGHSQATEFFQFAGMMGVDVIIFCLLSMRYKYVDEE